MQNVFYEIKCTVVVQADNEILSKITDFRWNSVISHEKTEKMIKKLKPL